MTVTMPGRGPDNHSGGSYDRSAQRDIIETGPFHGAIQLLSGTADAISPYNGGNYIITTGSADAMTLAAPIAGALQNGGADNLQIAVVSNTAYAHTLTATGLLQTGAAGTGVLTFAAHAGAGFALRAYQGLWQLIGSIGITVTS
jgi:hypothetical protein